MADFYYKGKPKRSFKKIFRFLSVLFLLVGISIILYVLLPIISWQIYFQPTFASQDVIMPIPSSSIVDLAKNSVDTSDYNKPENWFKNFKPNSGEKNQTDIPSYEISIPAINIQRATVSTTDNDLAKHLVNYQGTGIPGKNGNAVIFGHSTLPQLFNPKDYKTIFANTYKLKDGDTIYVIINNITYTYKIFKIVIVDPDDSSALVQNYDDSYLTLVTCTPPGTIWKRLVIKAKLVEI